MPPRSNVLDVVRAVTQVAPQYPEIAVWWYVPRLLENPHIELLVEIDDGRTADLAAIAQAVQDLLVNAQVTITPHPGAGETRRLFRILSRQTADPPQVG